MMVSAGAVQRLAPDAVVPRCSTGHRAQRSVVAASGSLWHARLTAASIRQGEGAAKALPRQTLLVATVPHVARLPAPNSRFAFAGCRVDCHGVRACPSQSPVKSTRWTWRCGLLRSIPGCARTRRSRPAMESLPSINPLDSRRAAMLGSFLMKVGG